MKKFDKILVLVSKPANSDQPLLTKVARLAKRHDALVHLYSCAYNSYVAGVRFEDSPGLKKSREILIKNRLNDLNRHADVLRAKGCSVETSVTWDYPVFEAVIREALTCEPDLVVAHLHASAGQYHLSWSDWQMVRTCPVPLLLTAGDKTGAGGIVAAVDPMHIHDKPAALDQKIISAAQAFAGEGTTLHVVHALRLPVIVAGAAPEPVAMPTDVLDQRVEESHRLALDNMVRNSDAPDAQATIIKGNTAPAIEEFVKENDIGLLVMGAVARGRIKRIFIGSSAEKTLSRVPCDVLIVKPDEFVCPVSDEIGDEIVSDPFAISRSGT